MKILSSISPVTYYIFNWIVVAEKRKSSNRGFGGA